MLYHQLKLPYSKWFNPIFISYIGFVTQVLAFFKAIGEKKEKFVRFSCNESIDNGRKDEMQIKK